MTNDQAPSRLHDRRSDIVDEINSLLNQIGASSYRARLVFPDGLAIVRNWMKDHKDAVGMILTLKDPRSEDEIEADLRYEREAERGVDDDRRYDNAEQDAKEEDSWRQ